MERERLRHVHHSWEFVWKINDLDLDPWCAFLELRNNALAAVRLRAAVVGQVDDPIKPIRDEVQIRIGQLFHQYGDGRRADPRSVQRVVAEDHVALACRNLFPSVEFDRGVEPEQVGPGRTPAGQAFIFPFPILPPGPTSPRRSRGFTLHDRDPVFAAWEKKRQLALRLQLRNWSDPTVIPAHHVNVKDEPASRGYAARSGELRKAVAPVVGLHFVHVFSSFAKHESKLLVKLGGSQLEAFEIL